MSNFRADLVPPYNYQAELVSEIPSGQEQLHQIYYPGCSNGGKDGLLVRVVPDHGSPWLGLFAFGYDSPSVISGIFSMPDRESVCIVSAGLGHIVQADDPRKWEEVKAFPIMEVLRGGEDRLIFADFTTLTAYGPRGLEWRTSQLSWDRLRIVKLTSDVVEGFAWDAPNAREVRFSVELATGHHYGGSSPPASVSVVH